MQPCLPYQRDGIDGLLKRESTRLWYRLSEYDETTMDAHGVRLVGSLPTAVRVIRHAPDSLHGTDTLIREIVHDSRALNELRELLSQSEETAPIVDNVEVTALTDWREAPKTSPVLLLSASAILDARNPGPIIGPGTSYRILSVDDGVVALQIRKHDNQSATGYCNIGDFSSIDSDIASYRRERQTGRLGTARLGINKLSNRLTGATAT